MIRDRIVIGLQDRDTKLRLLKEEDLDLNKTVNICRASEIASRQLQSMKLDKTGEQVNAMVACENIRFSSLFVAKRPQRRRARRNGCFRRLTP